MPWKLTCKQSLSRTIFLFVLLCGALFSASAFGADLTVMTVAKDGTESPLASYRWVIEEDTTYQVVPGALDPTPPSVQFHTSYMPVVAQGDETDFPTDLDPSKRYFVSVLPKTPGTYSIGGAPLVGNGSVTVYLNELPIPTAQITIFIYEDMDPINNAWDDGEQGLEGFRIIVEDAGGRYGMSAGEQIQDAFGNRLGTQYDMTCDQDGANPGSGTYGCLDGEGSPIVLTDAQSNPIVEPLRSGPDGRLTIKNLAPGKYGILVVPPNATEVPPGSGNLVPAHWIQTSTIEGTRVIDAWVEANEPPYFAEFGPPGPHVSVGFVPAGPDNPYIDSTVLTGGATISGQVVNLHLNRPPLSTFNAGGPFPHTTPWVGLNLGAAGTGRGVYAARANSDGTFSIPNVPPGDYQLVVWDDYLDLLFAFQTVTVPDTNPINLGEIGVFQWFTRLENYVFHDVDGDGFQDVGEAPIPEQAVNIRWRDGTMYQSAPTDAEGFVPFDQVFPFFSWLVAEVDFARFKATGVTVTVDDGGPIPFGNPWSWGDQLNPQQQGNPFDPDSFVITPYYRTEIGPVLTQGFQGFLGQTSVLQWGKQAYGPGENGGISGVVYYSVTRAEDNPEYGAAEPWEPGIPRVQVNLYAYDATAPGFKGALLDTTYTDSWDDNLPANCQYGSNAGSGTDDPFTFRGVPTDCYDGMRVWNQVRPAVFDGGYAFGPEIDCPGGVCPSWVTPSADPTIGYMKPGRYVVEVVPPTGYEIVKSQDKNVDFGDNYIPSPQLLPPKCVGDVYTVPAELSLFPGVAAYYAGQELNDCDSKMVALSQGANAAADFFLFTQVPIAGHIHGFILDDTANEFDPDSPQVGEKYAPPWLPISIRDWTGRIITTTYSGEFGSFNVLVPSTYTANLPQPSGMSPNMLTACMNDPQADTIGGFFNPQYSTFCYTFQYMPGATTYLDTPVVPVAAFAGPDQNPLDCELRDGTPRIYSVTNASNQGPYLTATTGSETLTITSVGTIQVPNPAYDGLEGLIDPTVDRDFGFGTVQGTGTVTIGGVNQTVTNWNDSTIEITVDAATETGQLVVTRDNGLSTTTGVTVQVGLRDGAAVQTVTAGQSIQAAIDAAGVNDLILVGPGTYNEMVIMYKPVQLQGWGEGSTIINAVPATATALANWRQKIESLTGQYDLVAGQNAGFGGIEPGPFTTEEGAGVLVLAQSTGTNVFGDANNQGARVDGFTIRGASSGGGIVLNGYVDFMDISNNRIFNNNGYFGGGVRLGHPYLVNGEVYTDSDNDSNRIRYNQITQNGGFSGSGGGLSLYNGSDNYEVSGNFICGNFTLQEGAGIAHYGMSDSGIIQDNTILFNENFNQGMTVNGGGLLVSGQPPLAPATVSPGSGSVDILRNLIQGNSSGAGDGAGIRLQRINGLDVENNPEAPENWYTVDIINNMIFNNVAALAGGGISLQDTLRTSIIHNSIANNDNASTASEAFTPGVPNQSNPQPGAGIVSRAHSIELSAVLPAGEEAFSDPSMENNILWNNRSFYFLIDNTNPANILYGLCPDIGGTVGLACGTDPVYDDLAVLPAGTGTMTPGTSILTGGADMPYFMAEYVNGSRQSTITNPETTTSIQPTVAFDEGGNYIRLRYGPLTQVQVAGADTGELYGDLHIELWSDAINAGADAGITDDFDSEPRPFGGVPDIGADEVQSDPIAVPAALSTRIISRSPSSVIPAEESKLVDTSQSLINNQQLSANGTENSGDLTEQTGQSAVPSVQNNNVGSDTTLFATTESTAPDNTSATVPSPDRQQHAVVVSGTEGSVSGETVTRRSGGYQSQQIVADEQKDAEGELTGEVIASIPQYSTSIEIIGAENDGSPAIPQVSAARSQEESEANVKSYLEITMEDLAKAKTAMAEAAGNLDRLQKSPESTRKEIIRATDDLERALVNLEKAADAMAIAISEEEKAVLGSDSVSTELENAKKELAAVRKVLATVREDIETERKGSVKARG